LSVCAASRRTIKSSVGCSSRIIHSYTVGLRLGDTLTLIQQPINHTTRRRIIR